MFYNIYLIENSVGKNTHNFSTVRKCIIVTAIQFMFFFEQP